MSENQNIALYVGALASSLIGGVIVLFSDFAWVYNYTYVSATIRTHETWYLNIASEAFALILAIIIPLFFCSGISMYAISKKDDYIEPKCIQRGYYSAALATAVTLIGGLVFAIIQIMDEPTSWDFDVGFWVGWIAGGLTTLFYYYMLKNID